MRLLLVIIFVEAFLGCSVRVLSSKDPEAALGTTSQQTSPPPQSAIANSKVLSDFFIDGDSLSYNEYEVTKIKRWLRDEGERYLEPCASLKKNGRVLAIFEGISQGGLAAIEFGLASLFQSESKQLVVSQTRPRGGRHWIVDVSSSRPRVLFDSFDWDAGREEVWIDDLDKDGTSEIILELPAFYMFENLSPSVTPLPEIVFRYDSATRRYIPANPNYDYGLAGIDEAISRLDPNERPEANDLGAYLSPRLGICLRYVFAGRRVEGWSFFDRSYARADKKQMKAKIEHLLDKEPVYRFIYGMRPLKRRSV